jgi:predicted Zn-dependent peptidase
MRHTVTEVTLQNGAKGIIIHIPEATVMTYDINFRAGEYLVDESKWEVPHLMEHVLLGANERIPKAREFQAELEKNGAYSNATTGVYDITYEAECADFEWDRVLDLMLSAVSQPLFLPEEFNAEFGNVQEEMAARSNNHFRRLSLEMRKALGLIAKTDSERLELMDNVTVKDVQAHYKRTHHTPNMRFVVAGNATPHRKDEILRMLESVGLPSKAQRFDLPSEVPIRLTQPVYIHNDTVENLYFYLDTFCNRRLSDNETDALNLLNTILTETLYSRIFGAARERGLVYGMNSGIANTQDVSNWWFGAQVSEKNAQALLDIVVAELKKVLAGDISDQEIEAAQKYSLGRFQRGAQTVGGTAAGYGGRYFFDGQVENYYQVPERIRAVTKERMIKVARAMFADNIWGFGVLGNCGEVYAETLRQQLKELWDTPVKMPPKKVGTQRARARQTS